ncbi:MAG: 2-dehydropantoate 2-reductase N-terminal domain-containing protein, partial [Rhodospirillales bacterium]
MRIAIMGAGGIGAYYGACLARAGNDVVFIARGAHLQAMRKNGLKIEDFGGSEFTIDQCHATDDPATVGLVDAILFCVKMYDA